MLALAWHAPANTATTEFAWTRIDEILAAASIAVGRPMSLTDQQFYRRPDDSEVADGPTPVADFFGCSALLVVALLLVGLVVIGFITAISWF